MVVCNPSSTTTRRKPGNTFTRPQWQSRYIARNGLRIEVWLGIDRGGDARVWLAEQNAYDMWQAGH